MDRRGFLAAVGAAGLGLAGCASRGSPADYDVGMRSSAFDPQDVEVAVGSTLTWMNTNSRAHTVTAYGSLLPAGADYFASGGFGSEAAAREAFWDRFGGALATDETYEVTFEVAGVYEYFCVPHERGGMVGRVTVTE